MRHSNNRQHFRMVSQCQEQQFALLRLGKKTRYIQMSQTAAQQGLSRTSSTASLYDYHAIMLSNTSLCIS